MDQMSLCATTTGGLRISDRPPSRPVDILSTCPEQAHQTHPIRARAHATEVCDHDGLGSDIADQRTVLCVGQPPPADPGRLGQLLPDALPPWCCRRWRQRLNVLQAQALQASEDEVRADKARAMACTTPPVCTLALLSARGTPRHYPRVPSGLVYEKSGDPTSAVGARIGEDCEADAIEPSKLGGRPEGKRPHGAMMARCLRTCRHVLGRRPSDDPRMLSCSRWKCAPGELDETLTLGPKISRRRAEARHPQSAERTVTRSSRRRSVFHPGQSRLRKPVAAPPLRR